MDKLSSFNNRIECKQSISLNEDMPFNYLKAPYTPDEFDYLHNSYINNR